MRKKGLNVLLIFSACVLLGCKPSPKSEPSQPAALPADDTLPTITCAYQGKDRVPGYPRPQQGTYHYRVYLPPDYPSDPTRGYPCLFISDPGGHASMKNMKARIVRDRWIAIMLVEAQNGPVAPSLGNFLAAHDDAIKRFRCARKYATGMSGGARASGDYMWFRSGFSGLWLQAAGLNDWVSDYHPLDKNLAVYATFGDKDFNLHELEDLKKLPRFGFEVFPGGHGWAPVAVAERAFDWFEKQLPARKK